MRIDLHLSFPAGVPAESPGAFVDEPERMSITKAMHDGYTPPVLPSVHDAKLLIDAQAALSDPPPPYMRQSTAALPVQFKDGHDTMPVPAPVSDTNTKDVLSIDKHAMSLDSNCNNLAVPCSSVASLGSSSQPSSFSSSQTTMTFSKEPVHAIPVHHSSHCSSHQLCSGKPSGHWQGSSASGVPSDDELRQWFSAIDEDQSGSITAEELQCALLNGNWTKFDINTIKMLMANFDTDRDGTIDCSEFTALWKCVVEWQQIFWHFDRNQSGYIDIHELVGVLTALAYKVTSVLTLASQKYAICNTSGCLRGIAFDHFVAVMAMAETPQLKADDR